MKRIAFKIPPVRAEKIKVDEDAADYETTPAINVRAAKDRFSRLLEEAAQGKEIVITSDGRPKARLAPVRSSRRRFKVDWALLKSQPLRREGASAEEIVRDDRDGRA